jgi:hypothetical protein
MVDVRVQKEYHPYTKREKLCNKVSIFRRITTFTPDVTNCYPASSEYIYFYFHQVYAGTGDQPWEIRMNE